MTEKQIKLVTGALLHDIGKAIYRGGDGRNHSQSGYEYLKEIGITDPEVLNCVRYHHGIHLKHAPIAPDDPAYLVYFADNIAAASDRRESMEPEAGFDKAVPLASIFNILNGNHDGKYFICQTLDAAKGIPYPVEKAQGMDERFYQEIIRKITDNLRGIAFTGEYINSLLSILEANLSFIPSSTSKKELADISLYDHMKITAALAQCMELYMEEYEIRNFQEYFVQNAESAYKRKMFLLYSMDLSGIQSFIYTIGSKGALRGLRARSFYLEIVMEHIIDELLERIGMTRANLIYSGGGHCYLLFPNTDAVKRNIREAEKETNHWFLHTFGIALYLAGGYAECSANDLKNEPQGSYSSLYMQISRMISEKKAHRYGAEEIRMMNGENQTGDRECLVCRRMGQVDDEGRCPICAALEGMSSGILYGKFFTVLAVPEKGALPLPNGRWLVSDTEENLKERMKKDGYVRSYGKNKMYTGKHVTSKLWVGDYTTGDTFEELAQKAEGIERIGVLRADIDNLGQTFVSGFRRPGGDDRYHTISRTATLSRQLSLFFKYYINKILEEGKENRLKGKKKRNAAIVYSGGDDVFLVGAWNEVIEIFVDLQNAFTRFTQGTLTISGGIGIYHSKYPINIMARDTALLEERSKAAEGKNSITLFDNQASYSWPVFTEKVLGEKFQVIERFFDHSDERGKTFLYNLLELLRNQEERIQTARYIYLLSRMEPDKDKGKEAIEQYRIFSRSMYEWIKNPEDRRQVITAIYLYIYLGRGGQADEAGRE